MKQYYDSSAFRISPDGYYINLLTHDICKGLCSELKLPFAGLMFGEYCLCSNHTTDLEEVDSNMCDKYCSGNPSEICGSEDIDIIYVLDVELMGSVDNITITLEDETFSTDKPVKISVTVEASIDFFVILHFGDGTFHKFSLAEPYMIEKYYRIPGEYTIHASAADISQLQPAVFEEKSIIIEDNEVNFEINCPVVVEPKMESQCNVTFFSGSSLLMTFQIDDADQSDELNIPDPFYISAGLSIPSLFYEAELFSLNEKEVYLPYVSIPFKSYLIGFEFLVKTVGPMTFMILSPCSSDNYCEETYKCSSTCSSYNVRTCNDDKVLCSYIAQCIDINSPLECNLKPSSDLTYNVKFSFDVTPKNEGNDYYRITEMENYIVLPGDIIGFKTDGTSALWCRNATASEIQNGFEDKSPASRLGVRHYLRAIFSEAVNISLNYIFNNTGNQSISVSASNVLYEEPVTKKEYLPVQIPVSGVYVKLNDINIMVGKNVHVIIKIVNGSDLTVLWNYFEEIEEELFPGIPPEEGYSKDILCASSGDYVIKVNVSNLWASEVVSSDFHCLSAITRDWSLTSDSPKFTPPGKITFNLKFDGTTLPGSIICISDFGDGSVDQLIELSFDPESRVATFSHNYEKEGSYMMLTNISNPVDFEIFEIKVQIVEKMEIVSVVPYYALPENYPDGKMELKGPNKTEAPLNSTIYFEISTSGEVTKFIMNSEDFTLNQESTNSVLFHQFSKIGEYIIHFKAYNSKLDEYSDEVTVKVQVIYVNMKLDFAVNKVAVQLEEIVEFTISLSYFDLVSCIIFDGGDTLEFLAFGNEETCTLHYSKSSFTYYPNFVNSDSRKQRDVTLAKWKDDSTISILYSYSTEGEFTALVDIFNAKERQSKSAVITVEDGDYPRPVLWIDENSTEITNPIKKQRGYDFRMDTTAVFRSNQSYEATHLWTAVKMNGSKIERTIDLSGLKSHNYSAIRIPKRFLKFGVYKFMYTLTIYKELELKAENKTMEEELYEDYYTRYIKDKLNDKNDEIVNYENMTVLGQRTVYTYIEIIPTPLIPMIIHGGASYIVRGFLQSVKLEPTILTHDPDYPNEGEFVITWFCSRYDKNEKLIELGEHKYDTSNPSSPIEDRSSIKQENNKGGCFGKGPGLMEIGKGDYKLECNTLWGYNATYDIIAVIEKSGKVTESHLYLEVIEKSPPNLRIMCEKNKVCFPQVHGQYINPNSFILLKAECIENCGEKEDLSLKWKVYASDLTTLSKSTIEDWKSHTQIDHDRIGLNQSLFHSYPDLKVFLIEVTGILPDPTIPKGISFIHLIIANPPDAGECKISTTSGMALLDVFLIKFSNWEDLNSYSIVDYSIYVKYGDEYLHLSYGLKTQVQVILPYGDLEVWCTVENHLGGVTLYSAANFSTSLPSEEDLFEHEQQRFLERYLAEGKMNMACQTIIAKNSITMEYKRRQNIVENYDGVSEAEVLKKWEEFRNQEGIDSSYFTIQAKDEVREILTEQLEIRLDEESKVKNKELAKLLRLPMEVLTDAEILGGAFAILADNGPSDLSAKLKLMEAMNNMFEVINNTEVPYPEDLKVVLGQFGKLANSVAGSVADSNIGGNFLPSELKRAQEELDNNATEPNYFILYVEGNRKEVQDKLYNRKVDAAKNDQSSDSKEMVSQMKEMVGEIKKNCMEDLIVGSNPFYTKSKGGFQMTLLKNYASNLTGKEIKQGDSAFVLPDLCQVMDSEICQSNDIALGVQSIRWTQPLESYAKGSENLSDTSNVLEIDITPRSGSSIIPINDTKDPFIICIPQSNSAKSREKMKHVIPKFSRSSDILVYHQIFVASPGIAVIVNILPDDPTAPLILLFKYGDKPSLQDYDSIIKISDLPFENGAYNLVIGAEFIAEPEKNLSIAIGHFENDTNVDEFFEKPEQYNLTSANMTNEFTSNYSIAIALTGCYYFDEEKESWSMKGCKVSSSNIEVTCCVCNHLTSFGSGFFVAPNNIDFNYVFANTEFKNNITIYVTIIVLFSIFILFLIYARWKDRKDLQKIGATPLPDNEPADKYIYEILVFTGHQRNAGTKSNIFFILSGEDDETEVRHFADDKRSILQKGAIDVFVMSVSQSLGQLNYLRIWHDNSGNGRWSSWYCQYIVFRDVQTGFKYEFLVDRWFALEQDDGLIDRLIPVAGKEQMTEFSHLFSTNSRRNLADNHLWFSIFLRPPRSRFTRVQRVCCCMSVLCLSMLANAMYYERTSSVSTGGFKFGPLSLTPEQIAVGFVTNMLIFPPTFIMIFFFRKSRPRQLRPSRIELALKKQKQEWKKKNPEKSVINTQQNVPTDAEAQWLARKKRKFSLPWWCVFFGWLFVFASIGTSLFFVWAYGIEFGKEKTANWLTSLAISFVSSILVTQPMKVILMAIFVSCICRSVDHDEDDADEDEEDPHLQYDEEYLHDRKQRSKKITYRPMDLEALEEARKEREKEVKMYSLMREISAYFIFLWIITILSYSNRDPNNFYLREALINGFIKPGDLYVEFNNVNTEKRFWNWTYNVLVPELFASPWYNSRSPLGLRLFLDDRNNVKISYGVLRQVRIQPRSCKVFWLLENVTPECAGFGSMIFEDGTLYTKGWRQVNSSNTLVPNEYKYLTASQLKGYPFWGQIDWYGGGGYVVPLVSRRDSDVTILLDKLKRLEKDGWIDRHTRAIFVEFGIYNAQVNLFCAVTIVAEFLPGGGIIPYYHIDPIRLLNYHTGFGLFQMVIEIIFVIFTIYFTIREISNFKKQGMVYFKEVWNILELVSIIVSYTGIANHVYKLFMTAEILRIFTETDGQGYIKLQEAVLLNELFCYQVGLIISISTLKFLKLLRFNKRIGVLSSTLRVCGHELKSYSVCLMVVFVAFVILFWLLLGRYVREFSTFVYSFESSISMMLKKFNYEDMYAAQPIFTPIAFFTFSLATAVILINILLSIIIRSFENVKHDVSLQSNEYEIFDFFINRMKLTFGCGSAKVHPLPNIYKDEKKTKDTVSSFPDKVDKLVDFINDFYFENQIDFNSKEFLKKMNLDIARANGKVYQEKKKAKVVKASKSKIPKNVSDRFDDF